MAQRLRLLGDIAVDEPFPTVCESVWVEALQRFQQRHGLAVDGVVGKDSWAALRVTPGERVQQIDLDLERLAADRATQHTGASLDGLRHRAGQTRAPPF